VLYLLFNEGYGDPDKTRLVEEAIRLARVLAALMPDEPEAHGLLALMLLHGARRPARVDAAGNLVTLDEQDRTLWNQAEIAEGDAILRQALRRRRAGPFQLQAAIAACHATARVAADTDWPQIVELYAQLARVAPSAVVDPEPRRRDRHGPRPRGGRSRWSRRWSSPQRVLPVARHPGGPVAPGRPHRRGARELPAALDLAPSESERRFLSDRCANSDARPLRLL
jgi:RNA polymerase sigma-70 factor (ECF subfamily)